jgi:hypothetical protein
VVRRRDDPLRSRAGPSASPSLASSRWRPPSAGSPAAGGWKITGGGWKVAAGTAAGGTTVVGTAVIGTAMAGAMAGGTAPRAADADAPWALGT